MREIAQLLTTLSLLSPHFPILFPPSLKMKQIAVLSGKGGTGKTIIAASFAVLASERHRIVVADCDVEASNMHILLKPVRLNERNVFKGSKIAVLDAEKCVNCLLYTSPSPRD